MTLNEIREYAMALGINSLKKFKRKGDLIHTIQLREGHTDCFNQILDCMLADCRWYIDCSTKKV